MFPQVAPPFDWRAKNQLPAAKSMLATPALYNSTNRPAEALLLGSATSEMIRLLPTCTANVTVTVTGSAGMTKVVPFTVTAPPLTTMDSTA